MKSVLIAIGNSLRRDDGAAHYTLDLLGPVEGAVVHDVLQLTPEISEEISGAERVVFIDADVRAGETRLEPVAAGDRAPLKMGHMLEPPEIVALARILYKFQGEAWLCRIPGEDFGDGTGLSPIADANARIAAHLLRVLLGE